MLGTVSHNLLLKYVPPAVLDRAVAERIKKIDAITLVRFLAEGNRLGYKADDILDEDIEWVRPNTNSRIGSSEPEILDVVARPQVYIPRPPPSQGQDPLLAEQERNLAEQRRVIAEQHAGPIGHCPNCGASFPTHSGYAYVSLLFLTFCIFTDQIFSTLPITSVRSQFHLEDIATFVRTVSKDLRQKEAWNM